MVPDASFDGVVVVVVPEASLVGVALAGVVDAASPDGVALAGVVESAAFVGVVRTVPSLDGVVDAAFAGEVEMFVADSEVIGVARTDVV